ncbi:hypothetical protein [Mesobacterium pallidum]|uniref:hypothetical protein n=1 Tax=Mesobacterium pallidum TaxID=2872037 RepID=UPI001EE220D7|nr:hypothetical protein [Mesobacterium pallidum]
MIRALALSLALLAAPLAAETPQALLDRFDAIVEADGGLGLDREMTAALEAARASGPLDPAWAQVMVATAAQVMGGLARFERGFALLDEAEALAKDHPEMLGYVLSWRAYFEAWWGLSDALAATRARIDTDLSTWLGPEQLALIESPPVSLAQSPGFEHASALANEAAQLFVAGDLDQAEQLLTGLRLPQALADPLPLVTIYNALVSMNRGWIATLHGSPDRAARHYDRAFADLAPDGALRADFFTDATTRDSAHAVISALLDSTGAADPARRALLLDGLAQLAAGNPAAQSDLYLQQADEAVTAGDAAAAAAHVRAALALGTMDAEDRVKWTSQATVYDGYAALARGEAVDHDALIAAFVDLFQYEEMRPLIRIGAAAQVTRLFAQAGEPLLANVSGLRLFDYMAEVQDGSLQSGDSIAAMAGYWRSAADAAISGGFDMVLAPPDGAEAPAQVCQAFLEIPMCTLVLD